MERQQQPNRFFRAVFIDYFSRNEIEHSEYQLSKIFFWHFAVFSLECHEGKSVLYFLIDEQSLNSFLHSQNSNPKQYYLTDILH
jgi:hypothetical protein